ncbi:MAG: hypothetical protein ACP5HU_13220 [Phycisphaerae bacterium]
MRIRTFSPVIVVTLIAAIVPCADAQDGSVQGSAEAVREAASSAQEQVLASAEGGLLAYEGFDYEAGELTDKGSEDDAGWGGAWKVWRSDGISAAIVDEGLSFGTLETAGRSLRLQTNIERGFDRYNRASRALAPKDEVTGTVWHSHLIHAQPMKRTLADGAPTAEAIEALDERWEARVDVDSDGNTERTGLPDVMGFAAKADAKTPLGRLAVAGKSATSTGVPIQVDTTYLVLGKVEGLGGTETVEITSVDPESGESVQVQGYRYKATMWVLSEDNFEALVKGDWDESVLEDEHVQHATLTVESAEKATFSSDDFVQIHTRDWYTTGFAPVYDEIRYGRTLKSVTPAPEPEPEEDDEQDEQGDAEEAGEDD